MEEEEAASRKRKIQDSPPLHSGEGSQRKASRGDGDATLPSASPAYIRERGEGPSTTTLPASGTRPPPCSAIPLPSEEALRKFSTQVEYMREARRYKRYGPPPVTPGCRRWQYTERARAFAKAEKARVKDVLGRERNQPKPQLEIFRLPQ